MKARFAGYCFVCTLIILSAFYYLICFTFIYEKSEQAWVQGAGLSVFLDWVVFDVATKLLTAFIKLMYWCIPGLA